MHLLTPRDVLTSLFRQCVDLLRVLKATRVQLYQHITFTGMLSDETAHPSFRVESLCSTRLC